MKQNRPFFLLVGMYTFFLSTPAVAQSGINNPVLTLKQSIHIAFSNNPGVREQELQLQVAEVNKKQAKLNRLPAVNGFFSHGTNQGRSIDPFTNTYINQQVNFANYSLGSDVVLFNGFQLQNIARRNSLTYEASRMEFQDVKDRLALSVILAYLRILSSQDQLSASVKQVELSRKQAERLAILHREGAIAPSLLYDLQGQVANDELAIINNRNAVASAKLDLSQLMNVPFNNELQIEPMTHAELVEYPVGTPDEIYQNAVNHLSVIKATALRLKSAEEAVKAVKGAFFPIVSLSGNIYTNYSSAATRDVLLNTIEIPSGDFVELGGTKYPVVKKESRFSSEKISYFSQFNNNYSTSISVGVRIPILNAFRTKNQLSLARIQLKQAEYIEETSKIELRRQIEQAYLNMTSALERYKILLNQVASYSQSFHAAEAKFNAGASTQVDYLIAKSNLDNANINLILSKYDYILRLKVLDYYQGRLVF